MDFLGKNRDQINDIDRSIIALFQERLDIAEAIGAYKKEHGLPVEDKQREEEIFKKIRENADPKQQEAVCRLFAEIMSICKDRQNGSI